MELILFEDELADQLAPITIGRPAYLIGCAGFRLIDLVRKIASIRCAVRPHLQVVEQTDSRALLATEETLVGRSLLVNARLVPSIAALEQLWRLAEGEAVIMSGGRIAAAHVNVPAEGRKLFLSLARLTKSPAIAELPLLEYPHDIIRHHLKYLRENLEYRAREGYQQLSDGLFVAEGATLDPHVVTDTRSGPILLDAGATVGPFCYLRGPLYIGPGARIIEHASIKDGVTIGERSKVGGEVEASIIEPFSNKQHFGYLGHSYVGSWVNLGGTTNSDLKNTYGPVTIDYGGNKVQSGMQFVGCFVGDYSKTAINSSIFTGKTIGACSMVYGTVTTPVPSFTNYARSLGTVTELSPDVAVKMQHRMFARRGIAQRPCDVELLHAMHDRTRAERAGYGQPLSTEPPTL